MTDPFVPTGRELDEGVTGPGLERESQPKPGLLRRIFGRGAKHTGKNLTEVQLDVPDAVGMKLPGVRDRSLEPEGAQPPPPPIVPKDTPKPSPARSRRSSRATPATPPTSKTPTFVLTTDFVASVVTLSRAPGGEASSICRTHLASSTMTPVEAALLSWWLQCEGPVLPPVSAEIESTIPDELRAVIDGVRANDRRRVSLGSYQRQCDVWDRFDVAVRELTRKTRSFHSLEPLVVSMKRGDLKAATSQIDYDSAAWHDCRTTISEAIAALEATQTAGERPVMAKMPRSASDLPLAHRAVLSTVCVPSSLTAIRSTCRGILSASQVPDGHSEIQALVVRLLKVDAVPT